MSGRPGDEPDDSAQIDEADNAQTRAIALEYLDHGKRAIGLALEDTGSIEHRRDIATWIAVRMILERANAVNQLDVADYAEIRRAFPIALQVLFGDPERREDDIGRLFARNETLEKQVRDHASKYESMRACLAGAEERIRDLESWIRAVSVISKAVHTCPALAIRIKEALNAANSAGALGIPPRQVIRRSFTQEADFLTFLEIVKRLDPGAEIVLGQIGLIMHHVAVVWTATDPDTLDKITEAEMLAKNTTGKGQKHDS